MYERLCVFGQYSRGCSIRIDQDSKILSRDTAFRVFDTPTYASDRTPPPPPSHSIFHHELVEVALLCPHK